LLDRIDGDRVLLAELVDLFRADFPGYLRAAKEAIDSQDANSLRSTGHTLKGALANLSAIEASSLAAELEMMGKSNKLTTAQATLDRFTHEVGNAMRALDALCPTHAQ
jgi:HPt (histidine-containing phosphotransfer) domain-containing protein